MVGHSTRTMTGRYSHLAVNGIVRDASLNVDWRFILRINNMLHTRQYYKGQRVRADELEKVVRERTRELVKSNEQLEESRGKLQQAIGRAGREAGAYGRQLESSEDATILSQLQQKGKLRIHEFTARDNLLKLAEPVKAAYAREIDAEEVLARINALK